MAYRRSTSRRRTTTTRRRAAAPRRRTSTRRASTRRAPAQTIKIVLEQAGPSLASPEVMSAREVKPQKARF